MWSGGFVVMVDHIARTGHVATTQAMFISGGPVVSMTVTVVMGPGLALMPVPFEAVRRL